MLDRYWPKAALNLLYGDEPVPHTKERASYFRAGMRIPAMSIYCVFHKEGQEPGVAERGIQFMFRDVPCNLHKLAPNDFLGLHCSHSPLTTELSATVKAVGRLFPDRPGLVIDGNADLTLTATRIGTSFEKFQPGTDNNAPTENKNQRQESTPCSGIVAHCQTTSVSGKLHALHKNTAALPDITTKQVQDVLHNVAEKGPIPVFATNTVDAMISCALQETTLYLRSAIRDWAFSMYAKPVRSPNPKTGCLLPFTAECGSKASKNTLEVEDWQSLPFVCLTGMEADLLKKMLSSNNILKMEEQSWTWWKLSQNDNPSDDSIFVRILGETGDSSVIEIKTHRHLAFHGIADVLVDCVRDRIQRNEEVETLCQDIVGCRFAKDFGEIGVFRGQVHSYDRLNKLFQVRYDDGDIEEFEISELYTHLRLYSKVLEDNRGQDEGPERKEVMMNKVRESLKACKLMEKNFPSLLKGSSNVENHEKSPRHIVGCYLVKSSGMNGRLCGKVLSYDDNDGLFKVRYDDREDVEFLTMEEILPLLSSNTETSDNCSKQVDYNKESSKSLRPIHEAIATLLKIRRNKRSDEAKKICTAIVGCRVAKDFGKFGIFHGEVVSYDCENRLFKVRFDDGDAEEFDPDELVSLLKMYLNVSNDTVAVRQDPRSINQEGSKDDDLPQVSSTNAAVPPASLSRKRVHVENGAPAKNQQSFLKKMYDPDSFLGRRVGRMFGNTLYFGTIEKFSSNRNKQSLSVKYDDGETEMYKIDFVEQLLREYEDFHSENDPDTFRRRRVAKVRNGSVYYGTVEAYQFQPPNNYTWSVRYDDGTTETIDKKQLTNLLKRYPVEFAAGDKGQPKDV
jgi:hypothetical protein